MKLQRTWIVAALSAALGSTAFAAATPEELARLGKDLTPWGAEVAGTPFPIPKSGIEVWWNNELRYKGTYHLNNVATWTVDSAGRKSLNGAFNSELYFPNFDPEVGRDKFLAGDGLYYKVYNDYS